MKIFLIYIALINLLAVTLFSIDKRKAQKQVRRVPEKTLHLVEALGGVFGIVIFMYIIRHKNRKFSYFAWTYLLLFAWIGALYFIFLHK